MVMLPILPMDYTGRCQHLNTETHTATYRIHNPDDPDRPFHTVAVKVQCSQCKVFFRFLGDNPGVPADCTEAMGRRLGAWVSDMGDELGCMVAPLDMDEPLAQIAVQGRA